MNGGPQAVRKNKAMEASRKLNCIAKSEGRKLFKEDDPRGMNKEDADIAHIFFAKLQKISQLPPIERLFTFSKEDFHTIKTLTKINFPKYILWDVIKIIAKILNFPLCDQLEKLMLTLAECDFFQKIEKMFSLSIRGVDIINENRFCDIIESVLVICQHYLRLNITVESLKKFLQNMQEILLSKENTDYYKFGEAFAKLSAEMRLNQTRTKEVYPTLRELHKREVEKPKIYETASHSTVRTYIDSEIAVMRRDVVEDLHTKISKLKSMHKEDMDIPTYKNAKFVIKDHLELSLDRNKMIWIRIEDQERYYEEGELEMKYDLSPGSILLFTTSLEFEDLIITVVTAYCEENHIPVKILKIYGQPLIFHADFLMFEGKSFFNVNQNGSKVFNQLNEINFPIQDFMFHNSNFKLEDIELKKQKIRAYSYDQLASNLLQNQSNDTQVSLVLESLMPNEDYDDLKIINTLVKTMNKQVLIVCHSIDVLDELLLKIVTDCTRNVVRIGNRSKYKELNRYTIRKNYSYNTKLVYRDLVDYSWNVRRDYLAEMLKVSADCKLDWEKCNEIINDQKKLLHLSEELDVCKQMKYYYMLRNKKVIGITSNYAVVSNLFVRLLNAPVVIIRDACNMPEFHTVASLTNTTEHVILFEGRRNFLCKSLFCRLLPDIEKIFCLTKNCEIHGNIRSVQQPNIYMCRENLRDVESVRGMDKDIFFVKYDTETLKNDCEPKLEESSDINFKFEVELLFDLGQYLVNQGYKSSDIVIKVATEEQREIVDQVLDMYPKLSEIKTTRTIDMIGHKKKIVLFPITQRSNKEIEKIGKMICTLLSSAQLGFYAAGKIHTLAENIPVWRDIKKNLEAQDALGTCFPIKCDNHETLQKNTLELPIKKQKLRCKSKKKF